MIKSINTHCFQCISFFIGLFYHMLMLNKIINEKLTTKKRMHGKQCVLNVSLSRALRAHYRKILLLFVFTLLLFLFYFTFYGLLLFIFLFSFIYAYFCPLFGKLSFLSLESLGNSLFMFTG